jgi:hypothetical protein
MLIEYLDYNFIRNKFTILKTATIIILDYLLLQSIECSIQSFRDGTYRFFTSGENIKVTPKHGLRLKNS